MSADAKADRNVRPTPDGPVCLGLWLNPTWGGHSCLPEQSCWLWITHAQRSDRSADRNVRPPRSNRVLEKTEIPRTRTATRPSNG